MSAWDWFVLLMFVWAIAPIAAFTFLYWRDERRKKHESKEADGYAQYVEATTRYRKHR